VIAGEDEIKSGNLTLKNMKTGEQTKINVTEISSFIK
jgi:histidyl-tRNA synthetase